MSEKLKIIIDDYGKDPHQAANELYDALKCRLDAKGQASRFRYAEEVISELPFPKRREMRVLLRDAVYEAVSVALDYDRKD